MQIGGAEIGRFINTRDMATQRNVTSKSFSENRSATGAERELINTKGL